MLPWIRLFAGLVVVAVTTPANAAWRVVDGIDVASGSASTLLIGDLDERTSLYARCVAGRAELFLDSYDGGDAVPEAVGEVTLTISTDAGQVWSSPARYGREKSGYITTTWLTAQTIGSAVAALTAARSAISINVEFEEAGATTWDTDAKGSTAAGRKFLESCPASATAPPSATPTLQVPSGTGTPWVLKPRPETDGTTSYSLNGEALSGFGALLLACTSEGGIYAGFSTATEDLPGAVRGAPMQMTISFGTFDYDFDASVAGLNDIAITVFSQDTGMAGIVAEVLTYGVESITVTVRNPAGGGDYVRQIGTRNSAQAAGEFLARCEESAGGA